MRTAMENGRDVSDPARSALDRYRGGLLRSFALPADVLFADRRVPPVKATQTGPARSVLRERGVVLAYRQLQGLKDHRRALQHWFEQVASGGFLIVVVPHAFAVAGGGPPEIEERGFQRRYTPATLLDEVEEALSPETYQIRSLVDDSAGDEAGRKSIVLLVQKAGSIAEDASLSRGNPSLEPGFSFEPNRTRVEAPETRQVNSILALKLDHLGDFIMGLPALRKLRTTFPEAEITLVCGSWNEEMARASGLADEIVVFDALPRNPTEETTQLASKTGLFESRVVSHYDMAIDLRSDHDTRIFLDHVSADVKVGIGTRSEFPFLDIFLPIDETRHAETVRPVLIPATDFRAKFPSRTRGSAVVVDSAAFTLRRLLKPERIVVFGPYRELMAGEHLFQPLLDFKRGTRGRLRYDIALDRATVAEGVLEPGNAIEPILFENRKPGARMEFRLWAVPKVPVPSFAFSGGRLVRKSPGDVLHQSEYLMLLVEFASIRLQQQGALVEREHG